jgi:hypothetical protein
MLYNLGGTMIDCLFYNAKLRLLILGDPCLLTRFNDAYVSLKTPFYFEFGLIDSLNDP